MKVTYVVFQPYISKLASSIQIVNTCWEMARRGYSVDLLVPCNDGVSKEDILHFYGLGPAPTLNLVRVPHCPVRLTFWFDYAWFHLIAFFKLALGHLFGRDAGIYYLRTDYEWPVIVIMAPFARMLGIKTIVEVHHIGHRYLAEKGKLFRGIGNSSPLRVRLCRWCESVIFRNVSGIVAVTHNLACLIREEFKPRCPIIVSPNGARPLPAVPGGEGDCRPGRGARLIYMGGLYKWKGIETAIRAMEYLPEEVELSLLGFMQPEEGDELQKKEHEYLLSLISHLSLERRVSLLDFCPPRDLMEVIARHQVGLVPLSDTFYGGRFTSPLKLFEYMAVGIPVVASDLPSIREIVRDGEDAVLVAPSDPRSLAEGIKKLLKGGDTGRMIAGRAFSTAKGYTWERRAERISSLVEKVMAEAVPGSCAVWKQH